MPAFSRTNYSRSRNRLGAARVLCWTLLGLFSCSGCGMFGGAAQLKQLQAENDKLVNEYRAQRDKVAKLQETNVALEQRVAEAEKLLARSGHNLPSTRLSQIPGRTSSALPSTLPATAPPYVPPQAGGATTSDGDLKWRPTRRQ